MQNSQHQPLLYHPEKRKRPLATKHPSSFTVAASVSSNMVQRSVRGHPLAWRECQVYKRCILHVCWSLWRDFDGVISVACAWFLRLSYVFVTARKSSEYLAACCQNILGFAVDDVLPTVFPVKKCCSDILQLSFALPHPTACRCSFWGWCAVLSFWWRMRMMRKSANFPNNSGSVVASPQWFDYAWQLIQLRSKQFAISVDGTSRCQSLGRPDQLLHSGGSCLSAHQRQRGACDHHRCLARRARTVESLILTYPEISRNHMEIMPVVNEKYLKTVRQTNKQTNKQRFDNRMHNFFWTGLY